MTAAQGTVSQGAQIDPNAVTTDMQTFDQSIAGEALKEHASLDPSEVDPKTTLQGQIEALQSQFVDAQGNPKIPSWAQATARNVSRIASFSGMTGTAATAAMAQALLEASLPIAQQDAQFFQTLTLQNLDNKQQSTINRANVLAKLESQNMDARLAAAVQNSQAFLQMDLANLNNRQQAAVINNQNRVQALFEDGKQINAQRLFTAQSQNEMDRFYDELGTQVSQFNANQTNTMKQFNVSEINNMRQFNSDQYNSQARFNAQARNDMTALNTVQRNQMTQFNVDQSNSQSRFNTTEANAQNRFNAAETNDMTALNMTEANQQSRFNADSANAQDRFNASESNDMTGLNVSEANAQGRFNASERNQMAQFNAGLENQREQFYRNMQYNIDVSNAKWRQTVTLTENQQAFEAAATDVKNMVGLSTEQLNQIWDRSDNMLGYLWQSTENEANRRNAIAVTRLQAQLQSDAADSAGTGSLIGSIVGQGASSFFDWLF
jgi:hypothetical protein